jgi:hypothetical protein
MGEAWAEAEGVGDEDATGGLEHAARRRAASDNAVLRT